MPAHDVQRGTPSLLEEGNSIASMFRVATIRASVWAPSAGTIMASRSMNVLKNFVAAFVVAAAAAPADRDVTVAVLPGAHGQ
jgi:hypothetical protein